ncbi:hypothetical protein CDAR_309301 [Caerostris darwini]|uniref:Uncharacterized protein n=1 Tax=Caerostris darwini TaxID=1538125 RepID=A0AAV4WQE8_9ARAC|nr:hypothetical protein CDAR_309301 [Caerostris darwini]
MNKIKQIYFLHLNKRKSELIEKKGFRPRLQVSRKSHPNDSPGGSTKTRTLLECFYESTSTSNDPEEQIRDSFSLFPSNSSKRDIASDFVFGLVFIRSRTLAEMEKRYFFTVEIERSFERRQTRCVLERFLSHLGVDSQLFYVQRSVMFRKWNLSSGK